MEHLGPLAELLANIDNNTDPQTTLKKIVFALATVDAEISKSLYTGSDDSDDRPPNGDDYNDLFAAVADILAA